MGAFQVGLARVTICGACRDGAGAALARAVEGLAAEGLAGEGVEVRLAPCLLACGRPLALAVDGPGKGAYVFAGVDPDRAGDLAAFLRLFAAAPGGEVTDARPAGDLRLRLVARLPP